MPRKRPRAFSRGFKLTAIDRMMAGENVSALARELKVLRKDLYRWRACFRAGGRDALRGQGRPPKPAVGSVKPAEPPRDLEAAHERIAELERKIGQQQIDLDFFRQALRQVGDARRRSATPGAPRSTKSSKR